MVDDSLPPEGGHNLHGDSSDLRQDRSDRSLPNDPRSKQPIPADSPSGSAPPPPRTSAPDDAHGPGGPDKPRLDRSSPVGGEFQDFSNRNPNLGLQQHGAFPKVSSNFDRPASTPQVKPPSDVVVTRHQEKPRHIGADTRTPQQQQPIKSFAEAAVRRANKPADLFTHNFNLVKPIKMNEGLTVVMPEELYEQRLATYQFALIGRLLLPQGSAPRSVDNLKGELSTLFNFTADWTLMPLGKGFFSLKFIQQEDQIKVARQASWKLSVGFLQIRNWKPDFNPYKELSSTAQIWVRLFHLPSEYWHPEFLVGIFRSVGNVIKLDGNTAHGLVGHFARALVEVDLTSPLIDTVRVGLPRNFFYVDFSYENVPLLCTFCHFVGHSVDRCRKAKAAEEAKNAEEGAAHKDGAVRNKNNGKKKVSKQWVEKDEGEPSKPPPTHNDTDAANFPTGGVHTSNTYNALYDLDEDEDDEECVPDTPLNDNPGEQATEPHCANTEKESTSHFTAEKLLELVTVNESDHGSSPRIPQTEEDEAVKAQVIAQAQEIARHRQLRAELQAKRVATRSTTKISSQNVSQDSADTTGQAAAAAGQAKNKAAAAKTDTSGQVAAATGQTKNKAATSKTKATTKQTATKRIDDKLKAVREMGKHPTAYELHPGESGDLKCMDQAVFKHWQDLPDSKDDSDNDEDFTGGSPEGGSTPSP